MEKKKQSRKLGTEPYKGVRDFYPEDMALENYLFRGMREVAERYGYSEYGASILEPTELYQAKSGEEIVHEQTYTFTDRGGRSVTLRPEMTPTVARMVAARKRELAFPLRWYSIPNLFRYERPQRGRLREHFQLNVDIFGDDTIHAEKEIISVASDILRSFGLASEQFAIHISSAGMLQRALQKAGALEDTEAVRVVKLLDRLVKGNMDALESDAFSNALEDTVGKEKAGRLRDALFDGSFDTQIRSEDGYAHCEELLKLLSASGIACNINQWLTRGFDYYTGMIFEIFDTNPQNKRALFGGGRYNDLLALFGTEKMPAVGFGMGDVSIRDVLETYNLLPAASSGPTLLLAPLRESNIAHAEKLAQELRGKRVRVALLYAGTKQEKPADILRIASKQHIPFCVMIGETEQTEHYRVKIMASGEEKAVERDALAQWLHEALTR